MLRTLSILAALVCATVQAGELATGPFKVAESKTLNVTFKERQLIARDAASYLPDLNAAETLIAGQTEQAATLNLIRKDSDQLHLRREVALFKDGHLELTVRMRLFPYSNDPKRTSFSYEFRVPAERLDDAKYKAVWDRISRTKRIEGTFKANQKNGRVISGCRFLAIQTKYGDFVMDFDPYGVIAMGDYMKYGGPTGVWSVDKNGSDFVFSFGMTARDHGSIATGKMLLYEGAFDYDAQTPAPDMAVQRPHAGHVPVHLRHGGRNRRLREGRRAALRCSPRIRLGEGQRPEAHAIRRTPTLSPTASCPKSPTSSA